MLLRTRITMGAVASTLAIMVVMAFFGQRLVDLAETRFQHSELNAKRLLWQKIVSSELDAMTAEMASVTRDQEIRSALQNRDADRLTESASPAYKRLSTSGTLTKLPNSRPQWQRSVLCPRPISWRHEQEADG